MIKLLPNYIKKLAFPLGVLGIIGFIFSEVLADFLTLDETVVGWILKDLILVSMLLLVFSAEKEESAEIVALRSRHLFEAIGFGVVILVFDSLGEIIFWDETFKMKSGYELMVAILLYYIICFSIRKSIREPKNSTG